MAYKEEDLRKLNLGDPRVEEVFIRPAQAFIQREDIVECFRLDKFLDAYYKVHPDFSRDNKSIYDKLLLLQQEAQWMALPLISDEKVVSCYSQSVNIAWQMPVKYSLIDQTDPKECRREIYLISKKLEQHLRDIIILEDRDKLKNRVIDALTTSEELITGKRLTWEQKNYQPRLKHWFMIYWAQIGTGEVDKLKMAQFFSEEKNFQQLSQEEQIKLRTIFNLYEQLKLSSTTIQGVEDEVAYEDDKGLGIMLYGKLERYDKQDQIYLNEFIKKNEQLLKQSKIVSDEYFAEPKNNEENNMINGIPTYKPSSEPEGVVHDIFNELDAKELDEHRKTATLIHPPVNYQQQLAAAKKQLALVFIDLEQENRFDNLVISYLRGLRDEIEFKNMLTRPVSVGGMDYKISEVERIIAQLKNEPVSVSLAMAVDKTEKIQPLKQSLNYQQAKTIMQKAKLTSQVAKPKTAAAAKAIAPKTTAAPLPELTLKHTGVIPIVKRLEPSKPIIQDIKVPKTEIKLVGPLEELRSLTLMKFRRLAESPQEAAYKIEEKINLLEEQSFTEKAKGIVAFKNSPLNAVYLKVGNTSIEKGQSVMDIINSLARKGEEVLTKDEFDAIADLNKKLRF